MAVADRGVLQESGSEAVGDLDGPVIGTAWASVLGPIDFYDSLYEEASFMTDTK